MTQKYQKYKDMRRKVRYWHIAQAILFLILVYILVIVFMPFVLDGSLYRIESPFQAEVIGDRIHILAERRSLISLPATNYPRLVCNGVEYQYEKLPGAIVKGDAKLVATLPIPHSASGKCNLVGFMQYSPIPLLELKHEYYSVEFEIPIRE